MTFQEKCDNLIENLNDEKVINLMQQLGATRYIIKEDCIIFPTICHNENADEASMKLYYYKDSHLFMCYTSCEGQNIFSFLKHYYETRGKIYDWYEDIYCVVENCSIKDDFITEDNNIEKKKDKYQKREKTILPEYPKGILDVFSKFYTTEWLNDGITKEAMDKFNIKYSIPQNKIIIPHYDVNGRLIGIRGRALNQEEIDMGGKYMPVEIEGKWYKHKLSLNLYGLYYNKENIKSQGICYIFESEVRSYLFFCIPAGS